MPELDLGHIHDTLMMRDHHRNEINPATGGKALRAIRRATDRRVIVRLRKQIEAE
jgi:hypothetical protein